MWPQFDIISQFFSFEPSINAIIQFINILIFVGFPKSLIVLLAKSHTSAKKIRSIPKMNSLVTSAVLVIHTLINYVEYYLMTCKYYMQIRIENSDLFL